MRGADPFATYGATATRPRTHGAQYERQAIDEAKGKYNITDIAARWTKLERAGGEKKCICLFHKERTPSMQLSDAKGTFYCHGCGSGGDVVTLVMRHLNMSFVDAIGWLGAADLPPVDPADRVKAIQEERERDERRRRDALRFFAEAALIRRGDPADTYLRARGITFEVPPTVRFGMVPSWQDKDTLEWGRVRPCVVFGCQLPDGTFCGIQRVYFPDDDPTKGKAAVKLSLGQVRGAALRLGPVRDEIIVCEGGEDGLSLAQELPDKSVWPTLGTGMMPFVGLPHEVTSVMLAGQNDAPGKKAIATASDALVDRGLAIGRMWPDAAFKDWNDQLRGVRL